MATSAGLELEVRGTRLADARLRRDVEAAVRRRLPGNDAEDVVQAALADVLSAARVPSDPEEFRRFVFAVTRNKLFDHFRRRAREIPEEDAGEAAGDEPPLSARDLLRWAETKLPDSEAQHTLEWMLREGDGEKLEQIARDANVPAPRVRQRVSRLRRFLRERWAAELMLGALGIALLVPVVRHYYLAWTGGEVAEHGGGVRREPVIAPEPTPAPSPEMRGRDLRRAALLRCEQGADLECVEGLERARVLDPQGDTAENVVEARRAAVARLAPPKAPTAVPTSSSRPPAKGAPRGKGTPMPGSTSESSLIAPRPVGSESMSK